MFHLCVTFVSLNYTLIYLFIPINSKYFETSHAKCFIHRQPKHYKNLLLHMDKIQNI